VSLDPTPFADVRLLTRGFSIPELKWRELLFIGALKPDGDCFVRDPERPLPPFEIADLFPAGARLRVSREAGRVQIERL
jgi:hypothetical protein